MHSIKLIEDLVIFYAFVLFSQIILKVRSEIEIPVNATRIRESKNVSKLLYHHYLSMDPNRVSVCGNGSDDCRGTLWQPHWVFTTAECARGAKVDVYHSTHGNFNCSLLSNDRMAEKRTAFKVYYHPNNTQGSAYNVAVVRLDKPYKPMLVDSLNGGNTSIEFFLFEPWIHDVVNDFNVDVTEEELQQLRHIILSGDPRKFLNKYGNLTHQTQQKAPFFSYLKVVWFFFLLLAIIFIGYRLLRNIITDILNRIKSHQPK